MCIRKIIGDNVRYRRLKLHLTQTELAHKIGTTQKTICRIETYCQNTTADMLSRLSVALCVPVYTLAIELTSEKLAELRRLEEMQRA